MAVECTRELYARNPAILPADNRVAIQAEMADRTSALQTLNRPALVIHGELDPWVPVAGEIRTAEAIGGSRPVVLPRAGHVFFNETAWAEMLGQVVHHVRDAEQGAAGPR